MRRIGNRTSIGIGIGISTRGGGGGFKFASTDGSVNQSYTIRLPAGKSIIINWGDGNLNEYNGLGAASIKPTHTYSELGNYNITFEGDYVDLTYLNCASNNISGDVSGWSALVNLTYLYCNSNALSGDVSGWSALVDLVYLYCHSNNLSGDVSGWSALVDLVYMYCYSNNLSGDVSGWSALVDLSRMICNSNKLDFDAQTAWTALNLGTLCNLSDNEMTSTQVDNALISFAAGPFTNTTINLSSNAGGRTSASDTAVATLIAAGCTIITNGGTEP